MGSNIYLGFHAKLALALFMSFFISWGAYNFILNSQKSFITYADFLATFDLDNARAPSINVWVKEEYSNISVDNLLEILIEHCHNKDILLEIRDVSCRAISIAKQMKMYFYSDNLANYLLKAEKECLKSNAHACSAIFYSMMLMREEYLEYIDSGLEIKSAFQPCCVIE